MSARADAAPARILCFTASLGAGGAEKHLLRVVNHLDRQRFRGSAAVLRGGGSYEVELRPDVPLHVLGARRMAAGVTALRRLLLRERPDLVFSVLDHANCAVLIAAMGIRPRPRVVAGVQIPPSIDLPSGGLRHRALLAAIPLLYRRADHVVALSRGVRSDLEGLSPALGRRTSVIYNAGWDDTVVRDADAALPDDIPDRSGGPVVVACGRLTQQKGFPHLLRAFRRVIDRVPGARLWLVGEGELRTELQTLARELGIAHAVWFAGFRDNPYALMRAADVFVLSSLWEGFGNVVVEAMSVGTAVVSTDCPHGPSEILRDGESGLLVPVGDEEAMAAAVVRVLEDRCLRARLAANGRTRAHDFAAPRIAREYGDLFASVLARPVPGRSGGA